MQKRYKKFDDRIKVMIIQSGNPAMFPELNIPRSTALYWIKSSNRKISVKNIELDKALRYKILKLEKELRVEKLKNHFLSEVIRNLVNLYV